MFPDSILSRSSSALLALSNALAVTAAPSWSADQLVPRLNHDYRVSVTDITDFAKNQIVDFSLPYTWAVQAYTNSNNACDTGELPSFTQMDNVTAPCTSFGFESKYTVTAVAARLPADWDLTLYYGDCGTAKYYQSGLEESMDFGAKAGNWTCYSANSDAPFVGFSAQPSVNDPYWI